MDKPCIYKKITRSGVVLLILYVDDILLIKIYIYIYILLLQSVKIYLSKSFSIMDMREITYILRIKIYKDRSRRLLGLS